MAGSKCWSTLRKTSDRTGWIYSAHHSDHQSAHDCLGGAIAALLGRARPAGLALETLLGIAAFAALIPAALTLDDGTLSAPAPFAALLLGMARAAASALGAALLLGIKLAKRDAALLLGITRAAASASGATLLLGIAAASALGAALLLGT